MHAQTIFVPNFAVRGLVTMTSGCATIGSWPELLKATYSSGGHCIKTGIWRSINTTPQLATIKTLIYSNMPAWLPVQSLFCYVPDSGVELGMAEISI